MPTFTTMAELHASFGGNPDDGQQGVIQVADELIEVTWFETEHGWRSDPEPHVLWAGDWTINAAGGVNPGSMAYLYGPLGNNGQIGQGSYGWHACPIYHANQKYAAGLRLFERAEGIYWAYNPGNRVYIWTVLYSMPIDSQIAGDIDPADFESLRWQALQGVRKWDDTGWVQSPLTPEPNCDVWATHLYSQYLDAPTTTSLEVQVGAGFHRCWGYTPA